jgi:hypothetical protein
MPITEVFHIYLSLLNNVIGSDYIASNDMMINEQRIGRDVKGSSHGVISGPTQHFTEAMKKLPG